VLETEPETETETERAPPPKPKRRPLTSQHDLLAYYFRKDTLGLRNFDAFRAADFQLLLLLIYAVGLAVLPAPGGPRAFFVHALGWTLFNTFGLGLLLRAQGERKALVRHFVQHYHYPAQDGARGAVREAFANWKQLYNTSMCMTYGARFRARRGGELMGRGQCQRSGSRGRRIRCRTRGSRATRCSCTRSEW
jgi:hypothetical protein